MREGQLISSISKFEDIHEFMLQIDASFLGFSDDSSLLVEKFKSQRIAEHIEPSSECLVGDVSKVDKVGD